MDKGKLLSIIGFLFLILFIAGCSKEKGMDAIGINNSSWSLSEQYITGGLNLAKLYNNPDYLTVDEAAHLANEDLVLVYKSKSGVYVYPHKSMKAEVVNDIIDERYMAVTYCPITRSGNCWDRIYNNDTLLLTASGYLYKDNLMPYDINSESIWSQMLLLGAKGKFKGEFVSTYQLVETEWNNIKSYYPDARIFYLPGTENSTYTGNLKYTIEPDDNNTQNIVIPDNERIFGLVGKWGVELFQFDLFAGSIRLFDLTFENQQLIVAGSLNHNFIVAFEKKYTMTPVQNEFPVIMKDNSRTRWNIFGEAVSGQKQGERLSSPPSYFALGWAWKDLFDRIEVL